MSVSAEALLERLFGEMIWGDLLGRLAGKLCWEFFGRDCTAMGEGKVPPDTKK